jgi:hypothetical protein
VTTQPGRIPRRLRASGCPLGPVASSIDCARAIETVNEQVKGIFADHGQVPSRGLTATRRCVLGAVFVDQLVLVHRRQSHADLRVGLKAFLQAARRFMTVPQLITLTHAVPVLSCMAPHELPAAAKVVSGNSVRCH